MSKEDDLKLALDNDLKQVNKEEAENFKTIPVETMNRSERRSRYKYFSKMFKDHKKKKPRVNIEEDDPVKQEKNIFAMQRWATRYAILLRKLQELEVQSDIYRNKK